jgi:hypothetical protein
MGLPLDDIGDRLGLWDDGPCAPVQTRLRAAAVLTQYARAKRHRDIAHA